MAEAVVALALKEPALSPRKLVVSFVGQQRYFISESSVYWLLKAHDLITSPSLCKIEGIPDDSVKSSGTHAQTSGLRGSKVSAQL